MKILSIDIETRPNLVYTWGLWQQDIPLVALIEPVEILSWAAKWAGSSKVEFRSVFHDTREVMVKTVWDLLDEADVVLHFNGKRFDIPHLNREFLSADLTPPSPYKQIDLLETAKRHFKFPSNKLDYITKALGLESKSKHEGYDLWIKCIANDPQAWERMKKYNIQDVKITERLYYRLRPWISNHPSIASIDGTDDVCPACGSDKREKRGFAHTSVSTFQQFHCLSCGKWYRSTKRHDKTNVTAVI